MNRKPMPLTGLVNRPVIAIPEGNTVGRGKEANGRDLRRTRQPFDFPNGSLGILKRDLDTQQKAFVCGQPVIDIEIIKRPANCINIVRIRNPRNGSLTP